MEDKIVRYTLRVDRLLFKKFRYIAESEGRSANKEIEQYLKKRVADLKKETAKSKQRINKILISLKKRIELNVQSAFSLHIF